GSPPYGFRIDSSGAFTTFTSPHTFIGLSAGSHTVDMQDANDCTDTKSITVGTATDTTPPTITCPPNFSVQCTNLVPAPYADLAAFTMAGGSASDNCDVSLALSLSSDTGLVGGGCGGTVTRVYRVTDHSGNTRECTQVITVHDTTAPSFANFPSDAVIE